MTQKQLGIRNANAILVILCHPKNSVTAAYCRTEVLGFQLRILGFQLCDQLFPVVVFSVDCQVFSSITRKRTVKEAIIAISINLSRTQN
jgi:hypothetical protein